MGRPRPRLTVLYDADCRFCTRVAARMAAMDRRRRLRLVPLQRAHLESAPIAALAGSRDLAAALYVVDEIGDWASGGEAMLRAWERLPRLRILARLCRTALVAPLVEPAYGWVATHRPWLAWLAGDFHSRASP